jgi:hypothetical protein
MDSFKPRLLGLNKTPFVVAVTIGTFMVMRKLELRLKALIKMRIFCELQQQSYKLGVNSAALRDLFFLRFSSLDAAGFLGMFRCTCY